MKASNVREKDAWWTLADATVGNVARAAFRLRVEGAGNLPSCGGALLTYNHVSVVDAVFVALPALARGRIVRFFALEEDFERPVLGWALTRIRQIPIRRGFGDWEAIERSADAVRGGSLAGIAPEGTVGDGTKLLPGQKGAARIALMAEAPIVPVAVWGTQRRWPKEGFTFSRPVRPTVAVVYGNAIHPEGDPRCRPHVQALTDRIMGDIEGLLERARALSAPARSDPRRPGDDRRGVRPDV